MPSPLLHIAAEPSGLARTVHEYRTQLTDRLADEFTPLIPAKRRAELYQAAVRVVDEALPRGARGVTPAQIGACRERLRGVAQYLRDAPPTPPAQAELKLAQGRSALAAATAQLKAARRSLRAAPQPVASLARFRQEMHTAARDAAARRELEHEAGSGGGGDAGAAAARPDLMAEALQASKMQAALAAKRAHEASTKADADSAWTKHALALQGKRSAKEEAEGSTVRVARGASLSHLSLSRSSLSLPRLLAPHPSHANARAPNTPAAVAHGDSPPRRAGGCAVGGAHQEHARAGCRHGAAGGRARGLPGLQPHAALCSPECCAATAAQA